MAVLKLPALSMKHVIVGTAGHIDHGKSSLVQALTGTNPDRLEEEKRRGITIDLGFAFLDLDDVRIGFVDVPGHEKFVRNMLAGVGGIDLVLLVIAADESIKPQTREHFDICRLLGIKRGIIALTKCDLVEPDMLELVRLEVEDYVRGSFLGCAPLVPVSARTGTGLDRLKSELLRAAKSVPERDITQAFRLPIDRVFAMKGFGTVVTGTLISGSIRAEDEVELFPIGQRIRVRGLHSGGKSLSEAIAGQRTAVNLAGIEVGDVSRGMVLAPPGLFQATERIDTRITLLDTAKPLKNHARVHFHQGTCEAVAEAVLLDAATLPRGGSALAQLRIDQRVLVLPGDRFILRQLSPLITIGGGVVLDALPTRHRPRERSTVVPFLQVLETGNREDVFIAIVASEKKGMTLKDVVARTGWPESDTRNLVAKLEKAAHLKIVEQQSLTVVSAALMADQLQALRSELEKYHKANPLGLGIPKEDLRGRTHCPTPEIFNAALNELVATKTAVLSGELVNLAGREIALQPEEAKAKEQIEREFERAGLAVPRAEEVLAKLRIEPARARKLLQILLREKTLIKITEDLVFHQKALLGLRATLTKYRKEKGERLSVPVFKELTGISRKYAIPLLEYLDRERFTRRVGDERVIL